MCTYIYIYIYIYSIGMTGTELSEYTARINSRRIVTVGMYICMYTYRVCKVYAYVNISKVHVHVNIQMSIYLYEYIKISKYAYRRI
jgi:hypothetical protein